MRFYRGKTITLDLSPETGWILAQLMNETGHESHEIFIKSLLLYKSAVDAAKLGKQIAILDQDGEIDQEITGL